MYMYVILHTVGSDLNLIEYEFHHEDIHSSCPEKIVSNALHCDTSLLSVPHTVVEHCTVTPHCSVYHIQW